MKELDDLGGWEHEPLSEQDLAIAALVGRYVERGEALCAQDVLAVAAELGEVAVAKLRTVLAVYVYLHADLALKQRMLDRITPPNGHPGRYRAPDTLLAFLEGL